MVESKILKDFGNEFWDSIYNSKLE